MQITLVQAEIELAIRNHIFSQLRIPAGMDIAIDLAATRGADGFKATIDISPNPDYTPPVHEPAKEYATPVHVPVSTRGVALCSGEVPFNMGVPEPEKQSRPPQNPAELAAYLAAEEEKETAPAETEAGSEPGVAPTEPAGATPVEEAPTEAVSANDTGEKPVSTGRSLFRGLKKPGTN